MQCLWDQISVLGNIIQRLKVAGSQKCTDIFSLFALFFDHLWLLKLFMLPDLLCTLGFGNWNLHDIEYIYSCNMSLKFRHRVRQNLLLQGKMEILSNMKETSYLLTLFFLLCIWDFQEHSEQRPPEGTLWFPAADFSFFCFWAFLSIKLSLVKATSKVK